MTDEGKSKGAVGRRSVVLGTAAAVVGAGVGVAAAKVTEGEGDPATAEESFTVVDKRGRQRFLMSSSKPPIIVGGRHIPAEKRGGPDCSYLLFNDENGNEKGGIVAGNDGVLISLDYPNGDAIHLGANCEGASGGAQLALRHMGNPDAPLDGAAHPPGVQLFVDTEHGTGLFLCDQQGRPRIRLLVALDGTPSIAMLDESVAVVKQL